MKNICTILFLIISKVAFSMPCSTEWNEVKSNAIKATEALNVAKKTDIRTAGKYLGGAAGAIGVAEGMGFLAAGMASVAVTAAGVGVVFSMGVNVFSGV